MNKNEKGRFFELVVPSKHSMWKEDDITAALLVQPTQPSDEPPVEEQNKGLLSRLKIEGDQPKIEQRIIYMDGKVYPQNGVPNYIKNQKYSLLSFVPSVLFEQFRYFFNLFFLIVTLSQFIPILKVGFLFTYVAPLLFVLCLTMLKEAYDDYRRYKRDREANSQMYTIIRKDKEELIPSSDIKVGDIIEITANQRVPADCLLLSCSDPQGTVFIRTDQLDGETDWKLRIAIHYTQNYAKNNKNLMTIQASATVEEPKLDIYDFKGVFKLEVGGGEGQRESLGLENTLWCNTFLAAGKAKALVLYTGKQCRSALNSREPRSKMGRIDQELNYLSKLLCAFLCDIAFIIVLCKGFKDMWLLDFFRHVLLLSSIIPISLRVNLDVAKMYYCYCINHDPDIEGALARNSTIPEELGRVSYILTDKTGTLTQNTMIFKKLSLERIQFTDENVKLLRKMVRKSAQHQTYPMKDIMEKFQQPGYKKFRGKRQKEVLVRDLITALALCHNVTPTEDDDKVRTFQASSPDEIALVQIGERVGMRLVSRDLHKIILLNPAKVEEVYEILYEFPFSSERKRMGIILRAPDTKGVYFYLKGADTVMKSKVPEVQRGFLMDECEMLSREGLRTLVISQKFIPEQDYQAWKQQYEDAKNSLDDRDAKCAKALDVLEQDMELLGITGVEDMLQEDIQQTIEALRNAGMAIWMLTGDKVETAQCIAISTGLKAPTQEMYVIKDVEDSLILQNELNNFGLQSNSVLVIDGQSLKVALEYQRENFLQVACVAPAIVCCRCSPTQKALVTEAIKEYTQKICLSIGDGGNDVAMIAAADVGIGIVGKEGKQAALASDFSILRFKDIGPLLLWHGRLAYKRSAVMSQFVMHRGLIISIIQMIFSLVFYFVAIPVFNGWLMLGYATVYTMLPVFCLIVDEDVTKQKAMEYTELYKPLLKSRELTEKTFLYWFWISIYQGTIIITFAFLFFKHSFLDLVTVTFTTLIIVEILNVVSEIHQFRFLTVVALLLTFAFYIGSVMTLNSFINISQITSQFAWEVFILLFFAWLPLHVGKMLLARYDPSESDKIMKKIKVRS